MLWGRNNFLYTPSSSVSSIDSAIRKIEEFSPFCQGSAFSVECQNDSISPVSILFSHGGPSAITRFISLVIVYTLYCCTWVRWIAHVFVKSLERILPTGTNFDTSFSVQMIATILRIITPVPHVQPSVVDWSFRHSVCAFMSKVFSSFASARSGSSLSESIGRRMSDFSTRAFASPGSVGSSFNAGICSENCQSSKGLSCQIKFLSHANRIACHKGFVNYAY